MRTPDEIFASRKASGRKQEASTGGLSSKAISLAPSQPEVKRVKNSPATPNKDVEKPSEKMKKRAEENVQKKTLGESLGEAAALLPPGEGMAGRFLKNTISSAAAGATLGEYIGKARAEKKAKGKKKESRTTSEKSYE